jgi:hypothetical protein
MTSIATFCGSAAQAMPIVQFDRLAISEQSDYVGLLLQGAQKILVDARRSDGLTVVGHSFAHAQDSHAKPLAGIPTRNQMLDLIH